MSTSPAPEYALSFSSDAVHLMERSDAGAMTAARWRERASAPFDAPDFRSEMARLRKLVANGPDARVSLIIPDDQILYTSLPMDGGGDVAAGLGRALDGLTPYPVADLAWDWRPEDGQDVRVAAVARQTLREAEDFARRHGFDADGFLADPAEGLFPETPRFVDTPEHDAQQTAPVPDAADHADRPADTAAGVGTESAALTGAASPAVVAADAAYDKAAGGKSEPAVAPDPAGARTDDAAALSPDATKDAAEDEDTDVRKAPILTGDADDAVAAAQNDAGPDLGAELGVEAKVSQKPAPPEPAPTESQPATGAGVTGKEISPAARAPAEGDPAKAGASETADLTAAGLVAASGPVAASAAAPAKSGSGVTDFLPGDLPSAVSDAAAVLPAAPPSELTDAAEMPSQSRAPQPLPDRAKAVLDRAAAARSRRDSEPAAALERHPGARGGVGGLLLMLGALLLGLMLIWSFATPEPRLSGEPATSAAAPDTAIPEAAVQTNAAPQTVVPPRSDAASAVTSGTRTGAVPAERQVIPAATPVAPAPIAAAPAAAPVVAAPAVTAPVSTQTVPSAVETQPPSGGAPTTQSGAAAEAPAADPAAPAVAPAATAPAAAPAAPTPATTPATTSTSAPAAASAPSHAAAPKAVPAKPAATRPSTAPRRSQPAAAPAASGADPLPAVVPGRRALTRSERPAERPRRASTSAPETAAAPARTAAPAATAAPVRASRPASAPRSAPRSAPASAPRSDRATSAPAAAGSVTPAPRPRPRPDEGSADESVTAVDMTAAERRVAEGWLADLYRQNPALPRLSAAAAPQTGLVRLAEARPTRRPVADKTAVDAAVAEAAGTATPRKKKIPAAADGDRPAARSKAAAPKAETSKPAPGKAASDKTQTARSDSGDRPASRPSRKSAAPDSAAAVESAIAEAVGKSGAKPGKVAASAPAELVPPKKPSRKAAAPDAQAEAVAAAVAAPVPPAAAPAAAPETRTASRSPAPVLPAPAAAPAAPPADDPAVAAQRLRDEQLQAQAEARARAGTDAAARAEMQARAAAEARARAQEAAEERAAIASRGEYRPAELDDEPEVGVTAARGISKGQVASAATVGGMEIGKTQVIGVIGAGRASRGLIRLRNGKIVTVRLGDRIDGGAINSIGNGRISYVKGGRQFNLPILNGR